MTRTERLRLGGEAIALILKHEWSGMGVFGDPSCPECGRPRSDVHKDGCEWARVVRVAKEAR